MKKARILGVCAAGVIAVTTLGAGIASASTGAKPHPGSQSTFTVFTHMVEGHVVAPCSTCATPPLPAGSMVGTEYVNDEVFNKKTGGQQIGEEALVINVVRSDASEASLTGAVRFTGGGRSGQLTVSGEVDPRLSSGVVAVTGGTGSFLGAKGDVAYSGAGLKSKGTTLVIHLTS